MAFNAHVGRASLAAACSCVVESGPCRGCLRAGDINTGCGGRSCIDSFWGRCGRATLDDDLDLEPLEYLKLVEIMDTEGAEVVYGPRFPGAHARNVVDFPLRESGTDLAN